MKRRPRAGKEPPRAFFLASPRQSPADALVARAGKPLALGGLTSLAAGLLDGALFPLEPLSHCFVAGGVDAFLGGQRVLPVGVSLAFIPPGVVLVAFGAGEVRLRPCGVHLLPGFVELRVRASDPCFGAPLADVARSQASPGPAR